MNKARFGFALLLLIASAEPVLAKAKIINGCTIQSNTDCEGIDLSGANLISAKLAGANLQGANLAGARLNNANLSGANLKFALLDGAQLNNANLIGANLKQSSMIGSNLSGAKLNYAIAQYANMTTANLPNAKLISADLYGAKFIAANLTRADLSLANITAADLSGARQTGTKTTGAVTISTLIPTIEGQSPTPTPVSQQNDCNSRPKFAIGTNGPQTTKVSPENLGNMRAVHFTGNWWVNIQGIKSAVTNPLCNAPKISAQSVTTRVSRGSFVDSTGETITNDIAQVTLAGVSLGSKTFSKAGFWIGRQVDNNQTFIQLRPSLDSNLSGIDGFNGDVYLGISSDNSIDTAALSQTTGSAQELIKSLIVNGDKIIYQGSFSTTGGAAFDKESILKVLTGVSNTALSEKNKYWNFVSGLNAGWIGISVAIHNDRLADPSVKLY